MANFIECVNSIAEKYGDIGFEGIIVLNEEGETEYEKRWIQDYPRDIYSNTKSITSLAAGMVIHDGLLEPESRVIDIFEIKPRDEKWKNLKLKDLLMMKSGFGKPYLMYFDRRNGEGANNYLEYMLKQELLEEPGTSYLYSTGDTILAGMMIEKVTGMSLREYLYKKLFVPMNIAFPIWETDMSGHCCGGSGLQLKLEEMAKLGCLYLCEGKWKGVTYFDKAWINSSFTEYKLLHTEPYVESYGYCWRIGNHGQFYRATGSFGQDTLIFPKERLILGTQCKEGTDSQLFKEILRRELFDKIR